jgi:hypothetical protein
MDVGMNIITQSVSLNQGIGVYPLDHKGDFLKNIDQIQILTWGVKWNLPVLFPRGRKKKLGRKTETEGISLSAKKRLIKMTADMEELGAKVSHMITFTLPRQRWEDVSNNQKAQMWRTAKRKILRALEKLLSHYGEDVAYFWFQEFQEKNGRGAPHLHVLINIGQLSDIEWRKMLKSLIHIWKNSLKWDIGKDGEFPSQSVDFNRMRKRDFRYARKYSSKAKQKDAPFLANWGNWWGRGGIWRKIKSHDYAVNLNLLSKNDQEKLIRAFKRNTWLTWSMLKYRNKDLHEKIQSLLLQPFDYSSVKDKHTAVEKMVFERVVTELNKKDDMLFFKNTSSSFSSSIQIIPHPLLLCQEIIKDEENTVKSSIQLSLLTTIGEGV